MNDKTQDRVIALSVLAGAAVLAVVLLIVMGTVQRPTAQRIVEIDFERVDNIKPSVTEVKLAGLKIGKVRELRILTPQERAELIARDRPDRFIRVIAEVDQATHLSSNTVASIRQASLMSEHFIELTPGPPESGPLAEGTIIPGLSAGGLNDLIVPGAHLLATLNETARSLKGVVDTFGDRVPAIADGAAELMTSGKDAMAHVELIMADLGSGPVRADLKGMIGNLRETTGEAKLLAAKLREDMPKLTERLNALLGRTQSLVGRSDDLMGDLSKPVTRQNLSEIVANLRVVSADLKVVANHSKILTGTLAKRPWRLMFGGPPNELPAEEKILKSSRPVPAEFAE